MKFKRSLCESSIIVLMDSSHHVTMAETLLPDQEPEVINKKLGRLDYKDNFSITFDAQIPRIIFRLILPDQELDANIKDNMANIKFLEDTAKKCLQKYIKHYSSAKPVRVGLNFLFLSIPPDDNVYKNYMDSFFGQKGLTFNDCPRNFSHIQWRYLFSHKKTFNVKLEEHDLKVHQNPEMNSQKALFVNINNDCALKPDESAENIIKNLQSDYENADKYLKEMELG